MTGNVADQPLAEQKKILTRRNFLLGSSLAAGGLALYSGEFARHEISILSHTIPISNLPDSFHGFRIVQISDVHFDEFTEPYFVRRVVGEINRLAPDLVVLTGDFISFAPLGIDYAAGAIYRCLDVLKEITCPLRYAAMGNHDAVIGAPALHPIFARYGIPLLMNQHVPIERDGQRVWLCGVGDFLTEIPNLHRTIPERPDGPVLLMCHAPDYADIVIGHPRGQFVDLMLSGHSHGGQIRFPFVGAMHLPPGGRKYIEGLFHLGSMQLYVNRGIGTVGLPFRLNCPPEITLFTLQRA